MKIEVTNEENEVFMLLDECTKNLKNEHGLTTSCRVAGGWVRDKLLGSDSNDIDIALENMMGLTFAEHFVQFVAREKGITEAKVTKIERNPNQSKHLETARAKVLGIELDLVNLRSEEYSEGSRIPSDIAFGTPLQDAMRRDTTINALFYNVHTQSVEDLTEKGLDDLRNGIIRTPLPPRETFLDDPLRVIRCARFASRFGFELLPELKNAAADPDIQEAFAHKISRERVGEELDKMLKGRDPLLSIRLIHEISLYSSVFTIPPAISNAFSSAPTLPITSVAAATILQALIDPATSDAFSTRLPTIHQTLTSQVGSSKGTRALLFLAAALTPFRGITYMDAKSKKQHAVEAAVREGTKLGSQNHYLDGVTPLFIAADMLKIPNLQNEKLRSPSERVAIGLLLRDKFVHNPNTGSHWTTSILFSLVQELTPFYDAEKDQLNVEEASVIIQTYNTFVQRIEELGLPKDVDAKPMLDGRRVVQLLSATPGQWTGKVLTKVMEWQLDHPRGTPAECEAWLKGEHEGGQIQVEANSTGGKRGSGGEEGASKKKAKK
ncbi:hypothetical protein FIBSPDRAFT_750637 [Athelia psychrophila]|uniref:Poly A polymerase head domain-containing protein n=1 Tax=Athelia psychrophila TaxID=1759441 RepID=A0A166DZJ1_9AGAM|nr:hypothetical protein FIBSPDRAFT_750637 [Fibularhizoctonia sp. CBS 109695]